MPSGLTTAALLAAFLFAFLAIDWVAGGLAGLAVINEILVVLSARHEDG